MKLSFLKLDKAQLIAAAHTYWQFFVAAFGLSYAASGLDVTQITDIDSAKRFLFALIGAAGAAALSAGKAIVKNLSKVIGGGTWTSDEIKSALADLEPAPDLPSTSLLTGDAALAGVPPAAPLVSDLPATSLAPAPVEPTPAPAPEPAAPVAPSAIEQAAAQAAGVAVADPVAPTESVTFTSAPQS